MENYIIECPRCGRQYHFQEIVMPSTVFTHVDNILRDKDGKITDVLGDSSKMEEYYFCDCCDAPLKIKVKLEFETSIEEKYDFLQDAVTVIR